ncbi:uncharacterized protein K444DRAFT_538865, partial [Hyaloscypha bicolor E]
FLIIKKITRTYKLINTAIKINSVTLQDANLPLSTNEISEEFTKYTYTSLINFFSGYN